MKRRVATVAAGSSPAARRATGLASVLLAACSVRAPAPPAGHPANAAAPIGRLAGPPPALRPGAVTYPDVPPLRTAAPVHHHAP